MLINLKEIVELVEKKSCAIGAFNTPNLECVNAVIEAAEKQNVPVILAHAQIHENLASIDTIAPILLNAAKRAKVPVCVHLDHCEDLDFLKKAMELGFTGAMYDGSLLPYEENLENTKKAVDIAKKYNCGVEAELGAMPSREGGEENKSSGPVYTNAGEAVEFCNETGIDLLAPSFGTAHGIYKSKPVLNLDLVKEISDKTGLPLVMHGGSGVSHEDYRKAINNGICKVNYYSYMSKAGANAVKEAINNGDIDFFHDIALISQQAMENDVLEALKVFSNNC